MRIGGRTRVGILGLPVDVEEGKEALGKLLSGVMGSGSCVASCPPSVILQFSLASTFTISLPSPPSPLFLRYPPTIFSAPFFYAFRENTIMFPATINTGKKACSIDIPKMKLSFYHARYSYWRTCSSQRCI